MVEMYFTAPTKGYHFNKNQIKMIEERYKAKYVGAFCTKRKNDTWHEMPVDVFYDPNPDVQKGHKHYFGMFYDHMNDQAMITDATSAVSEPMVGVVAKDGEVIVSGYRHDYKRSNDDSVFIDGGRDYLRTVIGANTVGVMVCEGVMKVVVAT